MTLHSAMQEVLRTAGTPLTPRAVADEINCRGLYQRADQKPVGSTQVSARARNYGHIFEVTDGRIGLFGRGAVTLAPQATSSSPAEATRLTVPAPTDHRRLDDLERALLDPHRFRSAREIDAQVLNQFGLYAIRARSLDVIPEPYRAVAEQRESTLIYLGEATGQTLQQRFLRNELRGRGHGTFFRSIGAVLGYRPLVGSIVGKANQRNYRFSPADTAAIVEWINANLEVSWVAFGEGVHVAEVALIRKHRPLLNLRDNPAAVPQLSELRAYCCAIAQGTALT
ncbi:GIY-YIG nuclease family protein [Microbacterium sp. 22296]|uniref:GIY-YIG nuclease family protein n=1 Tax=Microbacterium sp. 22296 TaxID=3453903 RepID=UPI003F87A573